MFKILVYKTNGQYTKARKRYEEMEAASVVEVRQLTAKLLTSGYSGQVTH